MSNYDDTMTVIRAISGQENTIVIPRAFIRFMGSVSGGLFLNQLVFWSDKGADDQFFYKSYREWEDETTLSEYHVRKSAQQCKAMGFLETKVKKIGGDPTLHYHLKKQEFSVSFLKFLRNQETEKFKEGNLKIQVSSLNRSLQADDYDIKEFTPPVPEKQARSGSAATDGEINPLITAIASVSKNVLTLGKAERDFEEAALTLFTFGASTADLPLFSSWWQSNGYYEGKPWLKTIVDHWEDFKAGKNLKRQTNGNGRVEKQVASTGLKPVKPGVY
jgi:hypothetical protein